MSKYTTTFLKIAEVKNNGFLPWQDAIELAKNYIFDFTVPFYNNNTDDLESFKNMFISHYLYEEIGAETPTQFKQRLYAKLTDIMPYYTDLYNSMSVKFEDIFETINLSAQGETKDIGTNGFKNTLTHGLQTSSERTEDLENLVTNNLTNSVKSTVEANTDSTQTNNLKQVTTEDIDRQTLRSDEPQTTITNNAYASELNKEEGDNTFTTNNTGDVKNTGSAVTEEERTTTDTGTVRTTGDNIINGLVKNSGDDITVNAGEHDNTVNNNSSQKGFQGDKNKLISEYRQNIVNINLQIIHECEKLFMQIF